MENKTIFSETHKRNIGKANKGKVRTEEQRERIAAGKKASWERIRQALKMMEQQQSLMG